MSTHRVRIANVRLKPAWRPRVTDHAIVRYLVRVLGRQIAGDDIRRARDALRSEPVETAILHGAKSVVVGDAKIVLDGRSVVTVLSPWMREYREPSRKPRHVRKPISRVEASHEGLRRLAEINRLHPLEPAP